ncbi:MAG: hypothetical protein K2Q32_07490 [Alphaproteobacteria bacterium]|nr:hypothetical protein [Alphaproteobacteria bacterium]
MPVLSGTSTQIVTAHAPANTNLIAVEPADVINMNIEGLLYAKGLNGGAINAKQFAALASEYLLQQFELTSAETTTHWWSSPGMFANSMTRSTAVAFIPLGLLAAMGVDIAVFGGGSQSLIDHSKFYYGMGIASLLTATLIGTAENVSTRTAFVTAASVLSFAAAYLAASDNPEYVNHWANAFTGLDGAHNAASVKSSIAAEVKANLQAQYEQLKQLVEHGGVGGKHVAVDGNPSNDYLIGDLAKLKIEYDKSIEAAATTAANVKALGTELPSQKWGLATATGFIGSFLILAQLQVANVITKAPKWYKDARDETRMHKAKKELVALLRNNPKRVEAKLSAVLQHMEDTYLKGVESGPGGKAEADRIRANLFSEKNVDDMTTSATQLFGEAIVRDDTAMLARAKRSAGLKPAEAKAA